MTNDEKFLVELSHLECSLFLHFLIEQGALEINNPIMGIIAQRKIECFLNKIGKEGIKSLVIKLVTNIEAQGVRIIIPKTENTQSLAERIAKYIYDRS